MLSFNNVNAQHNDGQAAVYNIVSGAVVGGIGAMINKKSDQKTFKVFLKGASQGAIGGYVVFESKRLLRNFSRTGDYAYVWPSKILNSAGNSMVSNAASNRDFWERWYLNIGFNHFEYDLKRERKFRYRILPFALIGVTDGFITGSLDMKKSLLTGHFVFGSSQLYNDRRGETYANTIKYKLIDGNASATIAHEIIHSYQYEGYFAFNSYLNRPLVRLSERNNFFSMYHTIFSTDFNFPIFIGAYNSQRLFGTDINDGIFEKEARYYEGH